MIDVVFLDFMVFDSNIWWLFKYVKRISPLNNVFSSMTISLYGFGRCSNFNGFINPINIMSFNDPKDIANQLWYSLNFTQRDLRQLGRIIDMEHDYSPQLYDSMTEWIGLEKTFHSEEPSYILSFFNHPENFTWQATTCIIWTIISLVLLWLFCDNSLKTKKA